MICHRSSLAKDGAQGVARVWVEAGSSEGRRLPHPPVIAGNGQDGVFERLGVGDAGEGGSYRPVWTPSIGPLQTIAPNSEASIVVGGSLSACKGRTVFYRTSAQYVCLFSSTFHGKVGRGHVRSVRALRLPAGCKWKCVFRRPSVGDQCCGGKLTLWCWGL